jgi:hypothetical protein
MKMRPLIAELPPNVRPRGQYTLRPFIVGSASV